MDIDKIIERVRNLNESPTNSNSANVAYYNPLLWKQAVTQDYQTPGESGLAADRFSGTWPVEKLSLDDIDSMVSASKEFVDKVEEQKNLRAPIRNLGEEVAAGPTNSVGGGQIAGTAEAGDDPPVRRKKRKRTPNGRVGSRKLWLDFMRNM